MTVRNGKLFSEKGIRSLVAVIARHVWPSQDSRSVAIEICLGQLDAGKVGGAGEQEESPSVQGTFQR
ncbi:hypothetical protein [Stutzerimonas zhaodongensis]|uniref:hypothetical protein n=1 Tax=Stutzerimonas TaxID=2901164 RepID=UPI003890E025